MSDAELLDDSCELDDYAFGGHVHGITRVMIEDVIFEPVDIVQVDRQLPRSDGIRFGRDFRGARTISFTMHVFGDFGTDGLAILDDLTSAWMGDPIRRLPGAVQTLRIKCDGRTRRVYGRSRRFEPISTKIAATGWAPVAADFRTVDHYFYDDDEKNNTVAIVPPSGGGLIAPLVAPLTTLGISYAPGEINVGGTVPCYPVFIIRGPISLPTIDAIGEWRITLAAVIAHDEFVVVDSRPWTRGVRRNGITNIAGLLTPASPRLSQVRLTPGPHEIILSGLDETGTSSLTVAWRDTYTSF